MLERDPRITRAFKRVTGADWHILAALDENEERSAQYIFEISARANPVSRKPFNLGYVRSRLFTFCLIEIASGRKDEVITTSPSYRRTELGTQVLEIYKSK